MEKMRKSLIALIFAILLILTVRVALADMSVALNTPSTPLNYTVPNSINFTFTPLANTSLSNCTLFVWYAAGAQAFNITNSTAVANSAVYNFTTPIAIDSNYKWNVECINNLSEANFSAANRTFTVDGTNPVANRTLSAGTTVNEGTTVQFNGTVSADALSGIRNYTWKINGTDTAAQAVFSNQFNTSGIYNITLVVFDYAGNSAANQTILTVNEVNPNANITANQTVINEGQFILFNASNSTGNVGDDLNATKFQWDFDYNGTFASDLNTTVPAVVQQFNTSGPFNVSVKVFDEDTSSISYMNISVNEVNPVAVIFGNASVINEGQYILFNASNSTGNIGDALNATNFQWDFNYNGVFNPMQNTTVPFVSRQFTVNGSFNVSLRVFDEDGSNTTLMGVTVNDINPIFGLFSDKTNNAVPENANGATNVITLTAGVAPASNFSWDPINSFDWDLNGDSIFEVIGGSSTQTRNYNLNGTYNVSARVNDEDSSSTQILYINVTFVNDLPVYNVIATQNVSEDSTALFNMTSLANDEETLQINLTHACVSSNPNLTLSYNDATKILTFNASNSFSGIVPVNCTVTDLNGGQATTAFNVDIQPVNNPPALAALGGFTAVEDTLSSANLTSFMSDVDNSTSQLTLQTNSTRAYALGRVLVFNYTNLSSNFTEFVKINVTDGLNTSATQVVQINVTYNNDNPVLAAITAPIINEDSGLTTFDISSYVSDEENHTTRFAISTENTSRVDCNINGNNMTVLPAANWFGTGASAATCTVYAYENVSMLTSNVVTVSINVLPVYDNITFNGTISAMSWNEDTNQTYDLSQNFLNIDSSPITYGIVNNTNGNITVMFIGNTLKLVPAADWYGTSNLTLNASDGTTMVQSNKFVLTVNSVNDAPTLAIAPQVKNEDTGSYVLNLSTFANDVDGNNLTYTLTGETPAKVDCSITGNMLNYTLMPNFFGNTNCTVVANDGTANSAPAMMLITINNVDDSPIFSGTIGPVSWNEDTNTTFNLAAFFSEIDGQSLTYAATPVQNISISINNVTGIATLAPSANFYGTRYVIFNATDGTSAATSNNATLTVNAVNDEVPAVNFGGMNVQINEDSFNNTINLSDYVADSDTTDDNITWIRVDNNANILVSVNPVTKIMNVSGAANYNGISAVMMNASDGVNSASGSFIVTIAAVPDAPVLANIPNQAATVGTPFAYVATATDADGDAITFSDNTTIFNISAATGLISFTPVLANVGTHFVNITATDATGRTDSRLVTFTISNLNHAPACNITIPTQTWNEDTANNNVFDLDNYCFDSDGNTLTYTASTADNTNVDVTIDGSNRVSFTQPANWNGAEAVVFTAFDGIANATTNSVALIVNGQNDAPTSVTFAPTTNPKLTENGNVWLNVTVADPDSTPLVNWKVNGVSTASGNSYQFNAVNWGGAGTYTVTANVTDGNFTQANTWTITATAVPIASTFNGATTNFSAIADLSNAQNVILEKTGLGRITFTTAVDLSNVADLDSCVRIEGAVAGIDTSCLPSLANEPANIILRNVDYNSIPSVFYDTGFATSRVNINTACTFCSMTDYDTVPQTSGQVEFHVDHFTVFTAKSGANVTGNLTVSNIKVWVDGDKKSGVDETGGDIDEDVYPGSEVKIQIELQNEYSDDEDIDIKSIDLDGILKDIDDGDDIKESADISKIKADDKESATLIFKIPENVDADDYDLTVDIEGTDENSVRHTLTVNFNVKVEKKDNDLRIGSAEIANSIVSCKRSTSMSYRIFNAGDEDEEDITIEAKSPALGLNYKKTGLTLESDIDGENSFSGTIFIEPSMDVTSGTYPVTLTVYYDNGKEAATKSFNLGIQDCMETKKKAANPIQVEVIPAYDPNEMFSSQDKQQQEETQLADESTYTMLIIAGLILLAGLIIFEVGVIVYSFTKPAKKKKLNK